MYVIIFVVLASQTKLTKKAVFTHMSKIQVTGNVTISHMKSKISSILKN